MAEEGAVAEPRRLTTTQSRVRAEWCAACDFLDLLIFDLRPSCAASPRHLWSPLVGFGRVIM